MISMYEYKIHPAALMFPMLAENELAELADDIKANQQEECITLFHGLLLDGRNRLEACKRIGVEPQFRELDDGKDPWKYAMSLNRKRRQLTDSQKAKIGLDYIEHQRAEAVARKKSTQSKPGEKVGSKVVDSYPPPINSGKSRDKAGSLVGLSGKVLDQYAKVRESGTPSLLAMVDANEVGIHSASLVAGLPKEKQAEFTCDPKKVRDAAAKIRDSKKKPLSGSAKSGKKKPSSATSEQSVVGENDSVFAASIAEDAKLLVSKEDFLAFQKWSNDPITIDANFSEAVSIETRILNLLHGARPEDIESIHTGLALKSGMEKTYAIAKKCFGEPVAVTPDVDTFKLNGANADPMKAFERIFETSTKEMRQRLHERCGVLWNSAKKNSPYSVDFEKFWLAYPAKGRVNKGKAWECWSKALGRLENVELCQLEDTWSGFLVRRAKEYSDSPRGQSEFCKHATTWLNGDAWTDSVESWMDDGTRVRTKSGLRDRAGDHLPKGRGSLCAPGVDVAEEEMSEEEELQHRAQMDKLFKGK